MIERVDFNRSTREGVEGVIVSFTYDSGQTDAYEVFGEPRYSTAMQLLHLSPDPECLMVNLRTLMELTVH